MKIIGLASDHAGFELKCYIKEHLESLGYQILDFGCNSDLTCDYPDYAHALGSAMDNFDIHLGIVFCGSGNGINMTVNKHSSVRSAICWSSEIANLARHHNDANVCSIPARFVDKQAALDIVDSFLAEDFDGGRHSIRVQKIPLMK